MTPTPDPRELALQEKGEDDVENWHVPRILPVICLVAVCFTYINIGGYYTYIELAAHADGIAEDWIGPLLTWSSIFAIVGCVIAYFCTRFGLFKPLFVSLLAMAAIVIMLSSGITDINILVSLFSFMTLWTFVDVYQSAMMGHMDRSGSLVALLPKFRVLDNSSAPISPLRYWAPAWVTAPCLWSAAVWPWSPWSYTWEFSSICTEDSRYWPRPHDTPAKIGVETQFLENLGSTP